MNELYDTSEYTLFVFNYQMCTSDHALKGSKLISVYKPSSISIMSTRVTSLQAEIERNICLSRVAYIYTAHPTVSPTHLV